MGNNNVQALPVDTINGCIVRGIIAKVRKFVEGDMNVSVVDFKNGVSVQLPEQRLKNALITCATLKQDKTYVKAYNLSEIVIFGSQNTDIIRAVNCQNSVFDTSNDDYTQDFVYSYSTEDYNGKNRFKLGQNDQGYVEYDSNGRRIIGQIDTTK